MKGAIARQTAGRGVPERRGAAVSQRYFVALGHREQVPETGTHPGHEPPHRLLPVRGADQPRTGLREVFELLRPHPGGPGPEPSVGGFQLGWNLKDGGGLGHLRSSNLAVLNDGAPARDCRPGCLPAPALKVLFAVAAGKLLRGAAKPGLDDQLLELVGRNYVKPDEDGWVSVEVRGREVDLRVIGNKSLLGDEMLDAGPEDGAIRCLVAECSEVGGAKRPLPHEQLVSHAPLG